MLDERKTVIDKIIYSLQTSDPTLFDWKLYPRNPNKQSLFDYTEEDLKNMREARQSACKNIGEKIQYVSDENLFKINSIVNAVHESNTPQYDFSDMPDHDGFGGNISTGRSWGGK